MEAGKPYGCLVLGVGLPLGAEKCRPLGLGRREAVEEELEGRVGRAGGRGEVEEENPPTEAAKAGALQVALEAEAADDAHVHALRQREHTRPLLAAQRTSSFQ